MNNSKIKIIGIYKIPYTVELYDQAFNLKYGNVKIPFWKRNKIKRLLVEELSSIVLIEVLVENKDELFDVGDFGQQSSDQAPYNEVFLNEGGTEIIARDFDVPDTDNLRIAFFLHYYNSEMPLNSSYGEIKCPQISSLPERLKNLIPYEPID